MQVCFTSICKDVIKFSCPVIGFVVWGSVHKAEYSLRESVSAQGREGRGFDSDPGQKKRLYSVS
jgi:hypothetical protein